MDLARSAKYILSVLLVFAGLIMGSCTAAENGSPGSAGTEDIREESFRVTFSAEGEKINSQTLSPGEYPQVPEVDDIEGARFVGWVDEQGRRAVPADTPVSSDIEYKALFLPILDGEGPYLFTGSGGLLRPDTVLDSTDLATALNALAGEAARARFPELSGAEDHVTVEELRAVLSGFYTSQELDKVTLGHNGAEKISRSQFAEIMNALLGRDSQARVIPTEDNYRIPDVSPNRQDYDSLMEASIAHGHSEDGSIWRRVELTPIYQEGYVLVEGSLYCADSQGFFVSDTVQGSLTFAYDGRYTSGDPVLDSFVSAAIADVAEVSSYSSPKELLRGIYDYCREGFGFMRRNTYAAGARGWELGEAVAMFESRSGNSASYAAAFWALARGLGYEATAVSGTIGEDRQPHAWVEIEIDGENYIFDPGAESGVLEGVEAGKDLYMLSEKLAAAMKYSKE